MKKTINWGIIGCGDVTEKKSGPAFNKVENSRLIAVMRRNEEKLHDYTARHGVPKAFTNAGALIEDLEVDAVYIATPPSTHCDYALKVAAAGKPCCVEKPMAMNYEECRIMIEAFESANLPLFVAYYRRSLPRFLQVKQWLDSGFIGKVQHLDWRYFCPPGDRDFEQDNWRVNPAIAGGGYFVDLASHGLNLFSYLLGPVDAAKGFATNQQKRYAVEDAVTASFLYKSGATASGTWNFGTYEYLDAVTIMGDKGQIKFSVFADAPIVIDSDLIKESIEIPHPENIQYFHIDSMVKHLRGETVHPSLGAEAAETNKLMDEILRG